MKKLKLDSAALNEELLKIVGEKKIGWHGVDHIQLATALIGRLQDEDGTAPVLDENQLERLRLVFRQTVETQEKVMKRAFSDAGYELDKPARQALAVLFSVTPFADKLAVKKNPKTGKPFIEKEPRAKRSKGFDDFIELD